MNYPMRQRNHLKCGHRISFALRPEGQRARDCRKNEKWQFFQQEHPCWALRVARFRFHVSESKALERPIIQQQQHERKGDDHWFAQQAQGEEKKRKSVKPSSVERRAWRSVFGTLSPLDPEYKSRVGQQCQHEKECA